MTAREQHDAYLRSIVPDTDQLDAWLAAYDAAEAEERERPVTHWRAILAGLAVLAAIIAAVIYVTP